MAVCWSIWLKNNRRVFDGHSKPSFQVYKRVKELISFWSPLCKGCGVLRVGDLVSDWNGVIGCLPL